MVGINGVRGGGAGYLVEDGGAGPAALRRLTASPPGDHRGVGEPFPAPWVIEALRSQPANESKTPPNPTHDRLHPE